MQFRNGRSNAFRMSPLRPERWTCTQCRFYETDEQSAGDSVQSNAAIQAQCGVEFSRSVAADDALMAR